MITFKKGEATKLIDKDSKLIPILEAEGWVEDKPKPKKKKKENDDSE